MTVEIKDIIGMTGRELADFMLDSERQREAKGLYTNEKIEGLCYDLDVGGYTVPLRRRIGRNEYVKIMLEMGIIDEQKIVDAAIGGYYSNDVLFEEYYYWNSDEVEMYLIEKNQLEIKEIIIVNLVELKNMDVRQD